MHLRSAFAGLILAVFFIVSSCQPEQGDTSRRSVNGKSPASGGKTEAGGTESGAGEGSGEGSGESGGEGGGESGGEGGSESNDPKDPYDANEATWYQDTRALLDKHCNTCHATQTPLLNTYDAVFSVADYVKESIETGTMPPAGGLSDLEKMVLIGWVKGGAKKGFNLSFVTPAVDTAVNGSALNVAVSMDAPADGKWSLFYTTTPDTTDGGIAIASDLATDVTTVSWNVESLPSGNYYLYATLLIGVSNYSYTAPGKVAVNNPVISLAPAWKNGMTGFVQSSPLTLPYTVTGALPGETYQVRVEYKRGTGGVWTTAPGTPGLTGHTLPTLDEGDDYYFRVTLLHGEQVKDSDESTDLVAVANSNYLLADLPGNCQNCHPRDGVIVKNLNVLDRIANAGNPMPPLSEGGLLDATQQLRVRLWFWLNYQD